MSEVDLSVGRENAYQRATTETADISSTGTLLVVEVIGDCLVSVNIDGDETADYALDVSADNNNWFEAEETYSGTDIRDTFRVGDRYLRLRVTTSASANDDARLTVQEAN
jgi:hypothetical protein